MGRNPARSGEDVQARISTVNFANRRQAISENAKAKKRKVYIRHPLYLLDNKPLTRESFSSLLERSANHFAVRGFDCSLSLIESVDVESGGDAIIVFNVGHLSVCSEAVESEIKILRQAFAEIPVVLIADSIDNRDVEKALGLGVRACIPTSMTIAIVVEVLRLVKAGGTYAPAHALIKPPSSTNPPPETSSETNLPAPTSARLTPRQQQILEGLRQGKPNKIIAYELNMQESTVKVHVRQIMKKLNVTNRTQVAVLASQYFDAS